jgi:ribosomal protein S18 acetylase RimI-like enzyme
MMPLFHIREATLNDAEAMAKVRIDTWRSAYKGIVPDDYLSGLSPEQTAIRWSEVYFKSRQPGVFALVAENDIKEVVGIAIAGPERDQDPGYQSEIYVLYVLPAYQNQGIGRSLVTACVQQLLRQGLDTLLIWIMAENPYRRFYETLGGRIVGKIEKQRGSKLIPEIAYGWRDIRILAGSIDQS